MVISSIAPCLYPSSHWWRFVCPLDLSDIVCITADVLRVSADIFRVSADVVRVSFDVCSDSLKLRLVFRMIVLENVA